MNVFCTRGVDQTFFVRIMYQENPVKLATCATTMCTFSEFMATAEKVIPTDYSSECSVPSSTTRELISNDVDDKDVLSFVTASAGIRLLTHAHVSSPAYYEE